MNNKKVLLGLVLAFVLLLGGASVLYTKLGASAAPDRLVTQPQTAEKETANASQGESAEDGAATKDEDPAADDDPARDPSAEETESAQTVPDFTVYDADGNEVHLHDFFGKPIVLNFWASWCGPCKMEMPDFHEKYLEFGDEVQFLMVNMTSGRETPEDAKALSKKVATPSPFSLIRRRARPIPTASTPFPPPILSMPTATAWLTPRAPSTAKPCR